MNIVKLGEKRKMTVITGKEVKVKIDEKELPLAESLEVNISEEQETFRDWQGNIHRFKKKPKIEGTIVNYPESLYTLHQMANYVERVYPEVYEDWKTKVDYKYRFTKFSEGVYNCGAFFEEDFSTWTIPTNCEVTQDYIDKGVTKIVNNRTSGWITIYKTGLSITYYDDQQLVIRLKSTGTQIQLAVKISGSMYQFMSDNNNYGSYAGNEFSQDHEWHTLIFSIRDALLQSVYTTTKTPYSEAVPGSSTIEEIYIGVQPGKTLYIDYLGITSGNGSTNGFGLYGFAENRKGEEYGSDDFDSDLGYTVGYSTYSISNNQITITHDGTDTTYAVVYRTTTSWYVDNYYPFLYINIESMTAGNFFLNLVIGGTQKRVLTYFSTGEVRLNLYQKIVDLGYDPSVDAITRIDFGIEGLTSGGTEEVVINEIRFYGINGMEISYYNNNVDTYWYVEQNTKRLVFHCGFDSSTLVSTRLTIKDFPSIDKTKTSFVKFRAKAKDGTQGSLYLKIDDGYNICEIDYTETDYTTKYYNMYEDSNILTNPSEMYILPYNCDSGAEYYIEYLQIYTPEVYDTVSQTWINAEYYVTGTGLSDNTSVVYEEDNKWVLYSETKYYSTVEIPITETISSGHFWQVYIERPTTERTHIYDDLDNNFGTDPDLSTTYLQLNNWEYTYMKESGTQTYIRISYYKYGGENIKVGHLGLYSYTTPSNFKSPLSFSLFHNDPVICNTMRRDYSDGAFYLTPRTQINDSGINLKEYYKINTKLRTSINNNNNYYLEMSSYTGSHALLYNGEYVYPDENFFELKIDFSSENEEIDYFANFQKGYLLFTLNRDVDLREYMEYKYFSIGEDYGLVIKNNNNKMSIGNYNIETETVMEFEKTNTTKEYNIQGFKIPAEICLDRQTFYLEKIELLLGNEGGLSNDGWILKILNGHDPTTATELWNSYDDGGIMIVNKYEKEWLTIEVGLTLNADTEYYMTFVPAEKVEHVQEPNYDWENGWASDIGTEKLAVYVSEEYPPYTLLAGVGNKTWVFNMVISGVKPTNRKMDIVAEIGTEKKVIIEDVEFKEQKMKLEAGKVWRKVTTFKGKDYKIISE